MKFPVWVQKQFKKKERIYIMPTKMGGYFIGLIFLMFLLSAGYSNNLLLIFTILLFGLNLMWLIQTHFHLYHLKLNSVQIQDGHAGDYTSVTVHWSATPDIPHKWLLSLESEDESYKVLPLQDDLKVSFGKIIFSKRGLLNFSYLKVTTDRPFGLYKSWTFIPTHSKVYIYPSVLKDMPELQYYNLDTSGEDMGQLKGPHGVSGLYPYHDQESKKISWKHYAKSGELVAKEGEELKTSYVVFKVNSNMDGKEFILSKYATQMIYCSNNGISFNLESNGAMIGQAMTTKYLRDCLRELAQC